MNTRRPAKSAATDRTINAGSVNDNNPAAPEATITTTTARTHRAASSAWVSFEPIRNNLDAHFAETNRFVRRHLVGRAWEQCGGFGADVVGEIGATTMLRRHQRSATQTLERLGECFGVLEQYFGVRVDRVGAGAERCDTSETDPCSSELVETVEHLIDRSNRVLMVFGGGTALVNTHCGHLPIEQAVERIVATWLGLITL